MVKTQGNTIAHAQAALVEEVPIVFTVNGLSHAVMMATPSDLVAFAYGFALSEGIIHSKDQVRDIVINTGAAPHQLDTASITIDILLSPRRLMAYKTQQKQRLGASGCGLCGAQSLQQAFPVLSPLTSNALPSSEVLSQLKTRFETQQAIHQAEGAIHGAMLVDASGEAIQFFSDIGRHNALDKLIGHGLQRNIVASSHYAVMSSRCSTELVQKAIIAKLAGLIHLSSPSQMAVALAQKHGLVLVHLTKENEPRIYSQPLSMEPTHGQ